MPSQVWGRSPQEASDNPYEYEIQDQFVREAKALLKRLNIGLQKYSMNFHRDDHSVRKAVWMLQLDAIDSLRDALDALVRKNHRVTAKLFRDVVETLDLAAFFHSETAVSNRQLAKWYSNEVIPNRAYRDFVQNIEGEKAAKAKAQYYKSLSRFTHRTYRSLLKGYGLGRGDMLWHDGGHETNLLVLPQTIAEYFAILADLMAGFLREVTARGLLTKKEVVRAVKSSLESDTIPRRFAQISALPSR